MPPPRGSDRTQAGGGRCTATPLDDAEIIRLVGCHGEGQPGNLRARLETVRRQDHAIHLRDISSGSRGSDARKTRRATIRRRLAPSQERGSDTGLGRPG